MEKLDAVCFQSIQNLEYSDRTVYFITSIIIIWKLKRLMYLSTTPLFTTPFTSSQLLPFNAPPQLFIHEMTSILGKDTTFFNSILSPQSLVFSQIHNTSPPSPQMTTATTSTTTDTSPTAKRPKPSSDESSHHHHQSLLPGLPDHIAQLCLSLLPPSTLSSVSHSWRRLVYSPSFPPFLSIYTVFLPTSTTNHHRLSPHLSSTSVNFASFDPISSRWLSLPPLPPYDPPLRLLLRHPSFISRNFPIQSVSVSGNLVLLAATADQFLPALSRPLIFNPLSREWSYGPPLSTPRRWCATGSSGGVVYVASGIGSHYSPEVARSVEKWDLAAAAAASISSEGKSGGKRSRWKWEKIGELRDGKFSREAIDAIGWRGKLCMVNVKGDAAKEGIIYDVRNDAWEEMPEGMLQGWRGPAAAMDEETIFVVDESKGVLKKYDEGLDVWDEIAENEKLKGAKSVAVGGGRACVVCGGGSSIMVVDVRSTPARTWVVDAPAGYEALDVHVLPRMMMNQWDHQSSPLV